MSNPARTEFYVFFGELSLTCCPVKFYLPAFNGSSSLNVSVLTIPRPNTTYLSTSRYSSDKIVSLSKKTLLFDNMLNYFILPKLMSFK